MTEPENPKDFTPPRWPNLAAALAAFQSQRPDLEKTSTADVLKDGRKIYSYAYSTLADVEKAVLPLLGFVGLAWHCHTELHERSFVLICTLAHESGELLSSVFPLPFKDNMDPQALGSYLTYWRRYALMLATGVSPESDDDDGASAKASTNAGLRQAEREPQENATGRQEPTERPPAGRGTRRGTADELARNLISETPVEGLPDVWARVSAGGHAAGVPSESAQKGIRDHLLAAEFPKDSLPGQLIAWSTGPLAQIAAYRLVIEAWSAEQYNAVDRAMHTLAAYTAMATAEPRFKDLSVKHRLPLGDYITGVANQLNNVPADTHPDIAEPARREPWDDPQNFDGEVPWDTGTPAVLEGT
jgi:hypothetical protein